MKINTQFAFVVALFTLSLPVLSAPATPDAGTLQRETQPSLQGPSSAKPSITPSTPVIEETQAERILVTRFVVEGARSEERRVGKECRFGWLSCQLK